MGRVLVQQPGTNTAKALTETLPKNVIIVDEDLKELRLHDGVTPGGKIIGQSVGSGVPIGTIIPFAGNSVPQGYLLCDGSAISRTDYASLFAVIGTIYGAGDGNSTFNLPDCGNRVPMMINETIYAPDPSNKHFLGYLPNITGNFRVNSPSNATVDGAFSHTSSFNSHGWDGTSNGGRVYNFNATRNSETYGRGGLTYNNVIPACISVKMIIKYI